MRLRNQRVLAGHRVGRWICTLDDAHRPHVVVFECNNVDTFDYVVPLPDIGSHVRKDTWPAGNAAMVTQITDTHFHIDGYGLVGTEEFINNFTIVSRYE